MANSYTAFLKKRKPAPGDFNWDDEWHQNEDIDDFLLAANLSKNRVLFGLVPSDGGSGEVDYTAGAVIVGGVRKEVAAGSIALDLAVSDYQINYVHVDDAGTVVADTSPPASGDYVPIAIADTDTTEIIRLADVRAFAQVVVAGHENIFINGDFAIDQENAGAAVAVTTAAKYFVDMCECTPRIGAGYGAVVNAEQVAGFGGFTYAGKIIVTTADTLAANETGHGFRKYIEFKNCQLIAGRWLVLAFKFQAKLDGVYSVAVQSGDASNSYVTTFDYAVAEAVQDVQIAVPVPSAKVVEGTNNRGLIVYIGVPAVGADATATLNEWQAGEYFAASTATDWEVTIGNYIAMTGLYGGPDLIPAEFPYRDHGAELLRCQRYLQIFGNAGANHISGSGVMTGATTAYIALPLFCPMRGTPAVSASDIASCYIRQATSSLSASAVAFGLIDAHHADLAFTVAGGTTYAPANLNIYGTLKLDARM